MIHSKSLAEEIADKIKTMLKDGLIQPGQKIKNEQELIEKFNVSRTTIREAVKYLVSKNILEIRRGKGTFVCSVPGTQDDPFGFDFINEEERYSYLWEARKYFEPIFGKLAAIRATEEEIRQLRKIAMEMEDLYVEIEKQDISQTSIDTYCNKDIEFHNLICKMTKNPLFERFSSFINKSVLINYMHPTFRDTFPKSRKINTHSLICEAIKNRNPELACKLCERHMRHGSKLYIGVVEENPS
ncbi:MAG: FadR family transcriptional regulator [Fusobacteriaceae bacterium]|jgi:GntR family transcriptional repressor for pyruvate dehydrogenase complex|nr:FadR family transcriptional regulator [Fusobacteriaceae bacterium]